MLQVSEREQALLLAALCNWQMDMRNEDLAYIFKGYFGGQHPLAEEEIEAFCERLQSAHGRS